MINLCLFSYILLIIYSAETDSVSITNEETKRDACVDKVNAISSNIAVKAAQEAKAAESAQAPAGAAAAHQIKEELAEKAIEAAKAAQASLAGKIALVEELTREKDALKLVITELMQSKFNAVQEAKAAESAQTRAGAAAAQRMKEELAEKAIEAAKAAQASLAGKKALVEELTREKDALKFVITELMQSKSELERAISAELKALAEEKGLEKVLSTALHVAESTASDADRSMKGVDDDLVEKEKVLVSALHRTQVLAKEEQIARVDLDNTKMAARKAVQAATEAKANAMRNKRRVYKRRR